MAEGRPDITPTEMSPAVMAEEDKLQDYNTEKICQFLREHNVDSKSTEILRGIAYNGSYFLNWEKEDYLELLVSGLTMGVIIEILRLRRNFVKSPESPRNTPNRDSARNTPIRDFARSTPSRDSARNTPSRELQIRPRKLGTPGQDWSYEFGKCLPPETGASQSLEEPVREYKRFEIRSEDDMDKKMPKFISETGRFSIAVLNTRCGGTLRFGVGDKKNDDERSGQVFGLALTPNMMDTYYDIMEIHFKGKTPKYFKGVEPAVIQAAQACISLHFVPVRGCDDESLYVMEVDVQPMPNVCENLYFYKMNGPVKVYYLREGNATNSYDSSDKLKEKELQGKVDINVKRLGKAHDLGDTRDIQGNLERLLCGNRSSNRIDDDNYRFVVINGITDPNPELFSWLDRIPWFLVLDLSPRASSGGGISHLITENSSRFLLTRQTTTTTALTALSDGCKAKDGFVKASSIGERLLIVNCSGGDDAGEIRGISRLMTEAFVAEELDCIDDVIVIVLQDKSTNYNMVASVLTSLMSRGTIFSEQVICFAEQHIALETLRNRVVFLNERQMQRVSWNQLNDFILDRTAIKVTYPGETIPGSEGRFVILSPDDKKTFKRVHMDILASNQCEEITKMTIRESSLFCEEGDRKIEDFLQGKEPDWPVYYLNDPNTPPIYRRNHGLVQRETTDKIVESLRQYVINRSGKFVEIKRVVHQYGSGATTIGRWVLWNLRKEMRCVVLDGSKLRPGLRNWPEHHECVQQTVQKLLKIRSLGETDPAIWKGQSEDHFCVPLLVLLDDSSDNLAKELAAEIERESIKRGINCSRSSIILLNLVADFNLEKTGRERYRNLNTGRNMDSSRTATLLDTLQIEQKLSDLEKERFKNMLELLKKKYCDDMEHMISFVIIAQDSLDDSEYVKKVVHKSLRNMDKKDLKILLYLSILKYYTNRNSPAYLPARICYGIAGIPLAKGWKGLTRQSRLFLRRRQAKREAVVLEVLHQPLALHLMNELLGDFKISDVIQEMLSPETNIFTAKENVINEDIHRTMKNILVDRSSSERGKELYSKLVLKIINERREGVVSATKLLERAYNILNDKPNRAGVAQTLARLYMNEFDNNKLEEALAWAESANALQPGKFHFHDTLGQVYRRKLRCLVEAFANLKLDFRDCLEILETGQNAAKCFHEAHKLYKSQDSDSAANNNPTLVGEIDINMEVAGIIMKTTDMENVEKRAKFLQVLRNERKEDIRQLFDVDTDFPWKNNLDFIQDLYERTKECFEIITKTFGHDVCSGWDKKEDWIIKLDSYAKTFADLFSKPLDHWRQENTSLATDQKLFRLRRYLTVQIPCSFGWLLRQSCSLSQLNHMQDILRDMENISKVKKKHEIGLTVEDKISYINVFFALIFKRADRNGLSVDTVREFCRELVMNDVAHQEPYLFLLILKWPNARTVKTDIEAITKCVHKLSSDIYSNPIFRLCNRTANGVNIVPEFADDSSYGPLAQQQLRISGTFGSSKETVLIPFKGGEQLEVPVEYHNIRYIKNKKVSFTIAFTYSGPLACDLEE